MHGLETNPLLVILENFIQNISIIPTIIYSVIHCSLLGLKWRIEKNYNNDLKINNPSAMTNLCQVDYTFMGKTNILTFKDDVELQGVIYNENYHFYSKKKERKRSMKYSLLSKKRSYHNIPEKETLARLNKYMKLKQ